MNIEKRIIAFEKLGEVLRSSLSHPLLIAAQKKSIEHNGWFSKSSIQSMIHELGVMLQRQYIHSWIEKYPDIKKSNRQSKRVGVIMAGNIPIVGFHDFLSVLITGNEFIGKLSADDKFLLAAIAKILQEIESEFNPFISFTESIIKPESSTKKNTLSKSIQVYIATGSNTSAKYFEYYFKNLPHLIRRNRNSIAILSGKETEQELKSLGKDILQYFGLGCRNVSKLYVPEHYMFDNFFKSIVSFKSIIDHNKYANNYNYSRSIYLMNKEKFWDNDFIMLKEDTGIASPVATLFYEEYKNEADLIENIKTHRENIQCVALSSSNNIRHLIQPLRLSTVEFGQTQSPQLMDYADGIDTVKFLLSL